MFNRLLNYITEGKVSQNGGVSFIPQLVVVVGQQQQRSVGQDSKVDEKLCQLKSLDA